MHLCRSCTCSASSATTRVSSAALSAWFSTASAVRPERRQSLASELGFSETVYVDDPNAGRLRIFTPAAELPFAGHPLVGTAWLLSRHLSSPVTQLNPPAGPLPTWTNDDCVWIRARPWQLPHSGVLTTSQAPHQSTP